MKEIRDIRMDGQVDKAMGLQSFIDSGKVNLNFFFDHRRKKTQTNVVTA